MAGSRAACSSYATRSAVSRSIDSVSSIFPEGRDGVIANYEHAAVWAPCCVVSSTLGKNPQLRFWFTPENRYFSIRHAEFHDPPACTSVRARSGLRLIAAQS